MTGWATMSARPGRRPREGGSLAVLLAADVGNTEIVLGVFDGTELEHTWRLSTQPERTPDELALTLSGLLAQRGMSLESQVTGFVVASVVPDVTATIREMSAQLKRIGRTIQHMHMLQPGLRRCHGVAAGRQHQSVVGRAPDVAPFRARDGCPRRDIQRLDRAGGEPDVDRCQQWRDVCLQDRLVPFVQARLEAQH